MSATTVQQSSPKMMFAILGQTNTDRLEQAIKDHFPNSHFALANSQWIVVTDGTAKTVSDRLGLTDGSLGATAVIVLFTSYYGRASTQVWEWLAASMEGVPRA